MGEVSHEQVNLLLRLYDLRREPRLRDARAWFSAHFHATTMEEMMKIAPPNSEENDYMRMVWSYWDMVASIVNRGLIDQEFFFENSGEQVMVWERLKPMVPHWREMFKNPHVFENLEKLCTAQEAWREQRAPGSTAAMREIAQRTRLRPAR